MAERVGKAQMRWNGELLERVEHALERQPDAARRSMFGYPAFFVGRKMFACVYHDQLGLKVPGELASRLKAQDGYADFCPMGHAPMREWVAVEREDALRGAALTRLLTDAAHYARANAARARKPGSAGRKSPRKTSERKVNR